MTPEVFRPARVLLEALRKGNANPALSLVSALL